MKTTFHIQLVMASFLLLLSTHAKAQAIADNTFKKDFAAQVKSLDEFVARFNGEESKPGIYKDANWRTNNLLSLFDFNMSHAGLSDSAFRGLLSSFVDSVVQKKVCLRANDMNLYAEAKSIVVVNGKNHHVTLYLQRQTYKTDEARWAIVGVEGMCKAAGIEESKVVPISSVDHEIHFLPLDDLLMQNCKVAFGFRGTENSVDELTLFFSMIMYGKLRFERVDRLTFLCFDVPGYMFQIEEINRTGANSGWLITKLSAISNYKKESLINKIINK